MWHAICSFLYTASNLRVHESHVMSLMLKCSIDIKHYLYSLNNLKSLKITDLIFKIIVKFL